MTESNSRLETKTTHNSASFENLRNVLISSIREYQDIRDDKWIKITDTRSTDLILSTYGDTISRQILNCVSSNPDTVMGIVSQCGIPQTTGYSKIIALIEYEFLVPYDKVLRKKSKEVSRYIALFKELQIGILGNQVIIRAKLSDFLQNQERI